MWYRSPWVNMKSSSWASWSASAYKCWRGFYKDIGPPRLDIGTLPRRTNKAKRPADRLRYLRIGGTDIGFPNAVAVG
jgi:hypothetical protein